ncbi:MAG: sulfite exporter TauE/SafE family protein [Clostridiales bacterium]|nr:sulfite exporter TauE/SafE family protein [Clostridiales bacterium]
MIQMILLILTGSAAGVISGMGIGGGTVLIPSLVFLFGLDQLSAQGINLIYFIPTALIALTAHAKNNNIETKILKPLILFGIIGAVTGSIIALNIKPDLLKRLFGIFLLLMGIKEILKK